VLRSTAVSGNQIHSLFSTQRTVAKKIKNISSTLLSNNITKPTVHQPVSRSYFTTKLNAARAKLTPGKISPKRFVPDHIPRPPYVISGEVPIFPPFVNPDRLKTKTPEEIEGIKAACRLARDTLAYAGSLVKAGISTDEIDRLAHEYIIAAGAYPSPLDYGDFPKSICTSVNEVMGHGIPATDLILQEGDIIAIDITVYYNGFHGDCCATFPVGAISERAQRILDTAQQCLAKGIEQCGPGKPLAGIGQNVNPIAMQHECQVSPIIAGHGIGRMFHEPPDIIHVYNTFPGKMRPGMVFTIEPTVIDGEDPTEVYWDDGWSLVSKTGGWSATFEHTVLITESGVEILTK
jgi:methionyl aminopeptidase